MFGWVKKLANSVGNFVSDHSVAVTTIGAILGAVVLPMALPATTVLGKVSLVFTGVLGGGAAAGICACLVDKIYNKTIGPKCEEDNVKAHAKLSNTIKRLADNICKLEEIINLEMGISRENSRLIDFIRENQENEFLAPIVNEVNPESSTNAPVSTTQEILQRLRVPINRFIAGIADNQEETARMEQSLSRIGERIHLYRVHRHTMNINLISISPEEANRRASEFTNNFQPGAR